MRAGDDWQGKEMRASASARAKSIGTPTRVLQSHVYVCVSVCVCERNNAHFESRDSRSLLLNELVLASLTLAKSALELPCEKLTRITHIYNISNCKIHEGVRLQYQLRHVEAS